MTTRYRASAALLILVAPLLIAAGDPVEVVLYGKPGCQHCENASEFLDDLASRRPEVTIVYRDVTSDPEAMVDLRTLIDRHGIERMAVPAIHVGDELFVGFAGAERTGRAIEAVLRGEHAADAGGQVDVPLFGSLDASELGLPLFSFALGLVDGFNPCAMWVLLFLLSLLVNLKSRRKMAVIGGTFVVVSGVVYFAFMAAWLNLFLVIGYSRPVQFVLGAVALAVGAIHIKDFFAFKKGVSLSIPEAAKPSIYARTRKIVNAEHLSAALGAVIVLAILVNFVELLCTAGLPAVFTQVLTSQGVPTWQYYAYLLIYILAYMLDDAIMVSIAVVTLSKRKLQERGGRWLKLISGTVIALLGLLLLFKPAWLSFGG